MSDKLPVVVIVPAKSVEPRWQQIGDTVGVAIKTVESGLQAAGWDVEIPFQQVTLQQPDGKVYDQQFCIRINQIEKDVSVLTGFANTVFGGSPRTAYLILVCNRIVHAKDMSTGFSEPSGTNGATLPGRAISFVALPEGKTTIGNGDGQTWAHEIGHGLGLDHVDPEKNLMHASRHGASGTLAGFALTGGQVATMQATLKKLLAGTL